MTLLKYLWSCYSNLFLLCFLYLIIFLSKGTFALLDRHLKLVYYILHFKGGQSWRSKYFLPEKVLWFEMLLLQKPAWGRNCWDSLSGFFSHCKIHVKHFVPSGIVSTQGFSSTSFFERQFLKLGFMMWQLCCLKSYDCATNPPTYKSHMRDAFIRYSSYCKLLCFENGHAS